MSLAAVTGRGSAGRALPEACMLRLTGRGNGRNRAALSQIWLALMTHTIYAKTCPWHTEVSTWAACKDLVLRTCPPLQARAPGLLERSSQAQVRTWGNLCLSINCWPGPNLCCLRFLC